MDNMTRNRSRDNQMSVRVWKSRSGWPIVRKDEFVDLQKSEYMYRLTAVEVNRIVDWVDVIANEPFNYQSKRDTQMENKKKKQLKACSGILQTEPKMKVKKNYRYFYLIIHDDLTILIMIPHFIIIVRIMNQIKEI